MKMLFSVVSGLLLAAVVALSGCGGGGGSVAGGTGGIGGTGVTVAGVGQGTTTGFGSIIINDTREFAITAETEIFRDGSAITETELEQQGRGFVTRVEIGEDVNADISSGTAVTVRLDNYVKGRVTSTAPLAVLGQIVVVTGDTVLVDLASPSALALGDEVEVSGLPDANNVIQATRLQRQAGGIAVWKLRGSVSNVTAGEFDIGVQHVVLNGVTPRDCGAGLSAGQLVEVKASRDPSFTAGSALTTVTDVECVVAGLTAPSNAVGSQLESEMEGLVTVITATNDFVVWGQRVQTTAATLFEGGTAADIVIGSRLEAEGILDTASGVLSAEKIRFRETRVRIEAPANVPGGGLGSAFTLLDTIAVTATALTEDNDGLIDGSGANGSLQVEVRGFVDSAGDVFATEIRDRGPADPTDVRLRGPASDTCDPLAGDSELGILGVIVDTGDPGTVFADPNGLLPDNTALCAQVSVDTPVQAERGTFSAPPARIDNAERIEIED